MARFPEAAAIRPVPATGFIARRVPGTTADYDLFHCGQVFARVIPGMRSTWEVIPYEWSLTAFEPTGCAVSVANSLRGALADARAWKDARDANEDDDWVDVDRMTEMAIEKSNDHWAWMQGDSDEYASLRY